MKQTQADCSQIGVVSDDPLRAIGLCAILEECPGVTASEYSLDSALTSTALCAVLVDHHAGGNLPEMLARFRRERPELRVVLVGDSEDPRHIQAVIGTGAKGYLSSTASEAEVRMAMEVVLDGSVWAPRKVLARLIEAGGVAPAGEGEVDPISERMTPREKDVLRLLLEGRSNRQIAESMGVNSVTVKAHLGRMLRKAGVKNRVELTLKAVEELQGGS